MRHAAFALPLLLAATATACSTLPAEVAAAPANATAPVAAADAPVVFPRQVQQGALVFGRVPRDSTVHYGGRLLRATPYGTVVFGVGRDQAAPAEVDVTTADGRT